MPLSLSFDVVFLAEITRMMLSLVKAYTISIPDLVSSRYRSSCVALAPAETDSKTRPDFIASITLGKSMPCFAKFEDDFAASHTMEEPGEKFVSVADSDFHASLK